MNGHRKVSREHALDYLFGGMLLLSDKGRRLYEPPKSPQEAQIVDEAVNVLMAVGAAREGDPSELRTILTDHGFSFLTTDFLIRLISRRGRGVHAKRGRPPRMTLAGLHSNRLDAIKGELRAGGVRGRIHETAMAALEEEHRRCCEIASSEYGLRFPPFDRDALENRLRRSKAPRTKKSRAK